jgi:hypothetical protein
MKVHNIRLIDNTYDVEIAYQLLKRFIETKIAFIKDRINETDLNNEDEINQLESRIKDLKAETRSLELFIENYDGEHADMEIGSTIVMSVKYKEST